MANETATAPRSRSRAASTDAVNTSGNVQPSAFAGKGVAELVKIGTPQALAAAKLIVQASGVSNNDAAGNAGWNQGLPYGTYSDCLNEDGTFQTFQNSEKAEVRKTSGRYVKDASGRKHKMYNAYLRLLPETLAGVSVADLGETSIVLFTNAKFGIMATPDGDNRSEYEGKLYATTQHSYQSAKFTAPQAIPAIDKPAE